jgi:hypothetical protein
VDDMKKPIQQGIFVIIFCFTLLFSMVSSSFATTSLTLTPTSGVIGSIVTASGTGYTPSGTGTITNSQTEFAQNDLVGALWAEPISIPTSGFTTSQVSLDVVNNGSGTFNATNAFTQSSQNNLAGGLWAEPVTVPSSTNFTVDYVTLDVTAGQGSHVRVKIYSDSSGLPHTLLGESFNGVGPAGLQSYTVSANVTAAVNDGTIWIAFETDSNSFSIEQTTSGTACCREVTHAFGTGPNPFGTGYASYVDFWGRLTYTVPAANVIAAVYSDSSGSPGSLLGASTPIDVFGTGIQNFPVSATVPANNDGTLWIAFETNNNIFSINQTTSEGACCKSDNEAFGTIPNPFGAEYSSYVDFWGRLTYSLGTHVLSFTWNGSPITTSPNSPSPNLTGGFSGVTFNVPYTSVGSYIVNASDTGGKFATQNFKVTSISLNVTSGIAGTNVNVSGNGFADNSALSLLFDTSHLAMTPSSPSTNSTGGFSSLAFTVPSNATVGSHTVKIVDASGNQATEPFTVQVLNISIGPIVNGTFTQTYKTSGGT